LQIIFDCLFKSDNVTIGISVSEPNNYSNHLLSVNGKSSSLTVSIDPPDTNNFPTRW